MVTELSPEQSENFRMAGGRFAGCEDMAMLLGITP